MATYDLDNRDDPFGIYNPYNSGAGKGNTGVTGGGVPPSQFPEPRMPRTVDSLPFPRQPGPGSEWFQPPGASPYQPSAQTPKPPPHILNDYWAPDRAQVLADPSRWGPAPGQQPTAPSQPTQAPGLSFGGGDPYAWIRQQSGSLSPTSQSLEQLYNALQAGGANVSRPTRAGGAFSDDKLTINGQVYDFIRDVGGPGAAWQFGGPHQAHAAPTGGSQTASQGNVFSDPATSEWEKLLRGLTDRLNQPQPQLTPAQLELQQTQALDPLERQRTAAKQQITERFAARGITPGSGILEQALIDVDRQFNQFRTQTQADFARQEIGRQDQRFAGDENRAISALNMFQRIPQLADSRLAAAQRTLIPTDPYGAIGQGLNQSAWQQGQDQAFWGGLAQLFAELFK